LILGFLLKIRVRLVRLVRPAVIKTRLPVRPALQQTMWVRLQAITRAAARAAAGAAARAAAVRAAAASPEISRVEISRVEISRVEIKAAHPVRSGLPLMIPVCRRA
jgi:transposase